MYSYDDRIRVVRLYIQYDKSAAVVIQEAAMAAKGKYADVSIAEFIKILDDYMYWYAEERIKIAIDNMVYMPYCVKRITMMVFLNCAAR